MIGILLALTMVVQTPTQSPWPPLRNGERAVLEDLYRATGGDKWQDHAGWMSATHPCDWHGVGCLGELIAGRETSVVVSLSLAANGLRGALPGSLARLISLHTIHVGGNGLVGDVPDSILKRWDADELEFVGYGNRFANLISKVTLKSIASGTLCADDTDVRFTLEVREDGTATFQSVRCEPGTRRTYCLQRDGRGPTLTRLSRGLDLLRFRDLSEEYDYRSGFTTHGIDLITTAWFGDGTSKALKTYNRQGPLEAWSAQQLFLGLLSQVEWTTESRLDQCSGV